MKRIIFAFFLAGFAAAALANPSDDQSASSGSTSSSPWAQDHSFIAPPQ